MLPKTLFLVLLIWLGVAACATPQPLNPPAAQQTLTAAWRANQHTIWEITWPAAPIVGGRLIVESWRAGRRYRHEILESPAPALIGEALVFDGQQAWRYNRLDPPAEFAPTEATLSPITDAFALIDRLLTTPPETASQQAAQVNFVSTQKIVLAYANGDTLAVWQNLESGLPERIGVFTGHQQFTLNARSAEPLLNPPDELFTVGEWLRN